MDETQRIKCRNYLFLSIRIIYINSPAVKISFFVLFQIYIYIIIHSPIASKVMKSEKFVKHEYIITTWKIGLQYF